VASLSKRERETLLTSRIVKENRVCWDDDFNLSKYENYSIEIAVKGLLIAVQLRSHFCLRLSKDCDSD
jgi:hypothetical protein